MGDLRQEMLSEIRAALGPAIPPHAMTFNELCDSLAEGFVRPPTKSLRTALSAKTKDGTWKRARKGSVTYYWKVE